MRDPHVVALHYRLETGPQLALPSDGAMRLLTFPSSRQIVLALTLLLLPLPAWAFDTEVERNTLKGITELTIEVAPIKLDMERDGLRRSQVQTDVELRLRQSAIRVVSSSLAVPCLFVRISSMKLEGLSAYLYTIQLELYQGVSLQRDPLILSYAATWNTGAFGTVGTERVSNLRSTVNDLVDQFVNAYLEQNPKP